MPDECIEPESEFTPNLVNTVSYMANMMIQVMNPSLAKLVIQLIPLCRSFYPIVGYSIVMVFSCRY